MSCNQTLLLARRHRRRKHYIHSLYFARYLCFDFCIKKSSKNIIYRLQTYTQYTHKCVSADGHMQPVFCSKKKTRKREKTFHSIFMCAVCRFFTVLPQSFVIFFLSTYLPFPFPLSFSSVSYSINFNLKVSSSFFLNPFFLSGIAFHKQ